MYLILQRHDHFVFTLVSQVINLCNHHWSNSADNDAALKHNVTEVCLHSNSEIDEVPAAFKIRTAS